MDGKVSLLLRWYQYLRSCISQKLTK
jgi:hypothetical protein